jgi:crotonobetainyl-CoA:carnitine CoA-transferase CaiB-like acyl-CoA transferase
MKSPPEVILPPSLLGEHTGDVLQKFGFSREEIQHLYTEKIVS